jgi:hypothetical protein
MTERNLVEALKRKQCAWAGARGFAVDRDGYCILLEENLFQPLSAACQKEFAGGDGSELGKGGGRGKIQALHSSAALACNVFDYWRGRDLEPLGRVLDATITPHRLSFEAKFPTGLGGIPPNVDVVLHGQDGVLAIESKFSEPYARSASKCYLKPKYFVDNRLVWLEVGLPGCQSVAEDLRDGRLRFDLLDAAQLLKHLLGLARCGNRWTLLCLWYRVTGREGDQHADELREFARRISDDGARFAILTYQELFGRMIRSLGPEHQQYLEYLGKRYFDDGAV